MILSSTYLISMYLKREVRNVVCVRFTFTLISLSAVENMNSTVADLAHTRLTLDGKLSNLESAVRDLGSRRDQDEMVTKSSLICFTLYEVCMNRYGNLILKFAMPQYTK